MKHLKQQFLTLLFLAASLSTSAQIGIGTTTPEGALDVVSANSGHVVPRVANTAAVVNPQGGAISNGTMVYDLSSNCIKAYQNGAWSDCFSDPDATEGMVTDREYGDGIHDFVYFPVTSPTGEVWLNNNLGAAYADTNHASFAPTQQATASNDHLAYGSLYQWGRYSDGHELINWTSATAGTPVNGTTATLSVSDTPANSLYITPSSAPYDWRSPQNDNLWQGAAGANTPCPSGYRLPTDTELNAERATWGSTDAAGALASPLKLPAAGNRSQSNGTTNSVGTHSYYWSSTIDGANAQFLTFNSSVATMAVNYRASGYSVRCIKD